MEDNKRHFNIDSKKRKIIKRGDSSLVPRQKRTYEKRNPLPDITPYDNTLNIPVNNSHVFFESADDSICDNRFSTKWNEEFQAYYEMPTTTSWERLERARKMNILYEKFINTAVTIGKTIIEELSFASQSKTISRVCSFRGIAGGEKYCYDGIFFKLATDPYFLYGGDHFSMKAAGHEIKAFNELLSCPGNGLHWPIITVIDYYGYRLVAEAALPISRKSLKYGSDDGCKTIHDDSDELRELIARAAEHLSLKPHIAGSGLAVQPRLLMFPTDVEGHLGNDNRYYLVDVQRLFPAEREFTQTFGVLIPADEKKEMGMVIINRSSYSNEISKILGSNWIEEPYPELLLLVYSSKITSESKTHKRINNRASCITKAKIYGDAFMVLGEASASKREVLYYMLRPEWLRENRPIRVSSDAFTNFGADNREEHEREILQLRKRLVEEKIPEFAKWLTKNNHTIISSLHFSNILHENGINLRYVGLLYMLIPDSCSRIKYNIIGFTMLARVIKDLLQAKLRAITYAAMSKISYNQAIVDFLNVVLGDGVESDLFWKVRVRVHLIHKYSPFGFRYDPEKDNFQGILGHLILFQLLQEYAGVSFNPSVETKFLPENTPHRGPTPLSVMDLNKISVKVKRLRLTLLPYIEEVCNSNEPNPFASRDLEINAEEDKKFYLKLVEKGLSQEQIHYSIKNIQFLRQYLGLTIEIFSENSSETISSAFQLSLAFSELGEHDKSIAQLIKGLSYMIIVGDIPGEILLSSLYIVGVVLEGSGALQRAHEVYTIVLKHIEDLFDSKNDKNSASPFEVECHQRLLRIAQVREDKQGEDIHKKVLERLLLVFNMSFDNILSLGRELIKGFLKHKNLSGIKLNYTQELQNLLLSLDDKKNIF